MQGTIEKIWQNEDKKGKSYWVLSINGQRFSVWDQSLMENISEGDVVNFAFQQKGRFNNITKIEKLSDKETPPYQDKSKQIIRMSCLRSAAEIVSQIEMPLEEKVNLVLEIAKQFETYVLK